MTFYVEHKIWGITCGCLFYTFDKIQTLGYPLQIKVLGQDSELGQTEMRIHTSSVWTVEGKFWCQSQLISLYASILNILAYLLNCTILQDIMSKTAGKTATQSFSIRTPARQSTTSRVTDFSPDRSEGGQTYVQLDRLRFQRLDLDKEFDAREYITGQLTYEDIIDLKQVFDTYDSTARKVWVPNDLELYLAQNGFNPRNKTTYGILEELDPEMTGGISFKHFVKAMSVKPTYNENQTEKAIASMFKKYDAKGKGYIDISDLREINKRLKENLDEETLGLMLSRADSDHDGRITFEDFKTIMAKPYTWIQQRYSYQPALAEASTVGSFTYVRYLRQEARDVELEIDHDAKFRHLSTHQPSVTEVSLQYALSLTFVLMFIIQRIYSLLFLFMTHSFPIQNSFNKQDTLLSSININSITYSKNDDTSNSTTILESLFRSRQTEIPQLFKSFSRNKENVSQNNKIRKTLVRKQNLKFEKNRDFKRSPMTKKILIDLRDQKRVSSSLNKSHSSVFSSSKLISLTSLNSLNSLNNSGITELKSQQSRIRVFSRIKPEQKSFFSLEGCEIIGNKIKVQGSLFHFENIFTKDSTQQQIFEEVGIRATEEVLEGYNSTIFVYGQTGSGKTYTMFGGPGQQQGIVPRAISEIFRKTAANKNIKYTMKASMLEIYKQSLSDLFAIDATAGELKMKESKGGLIIENLAQIDISNEKTLGSLIDFGQQSRKISSTRLNEHSSRSHTIIILTIQSTYEGRTKRGKLYLVDLAGSEKVSKSGAEGETLEEAKKINLSLSCLGNVINALVSRSKRQHIPYRDSKLTRVLQESLGGNCITSIIVNMSEGIDCYQQSISTLKFAQRVSRVKKTVSLNTSVNDLKSVGKLHEIIFSLQKQLQCTKQELSRYKLSQTLDNVTARLAIPSQRANVQDKLVNYNSKKNMKIPKMKLSININDFSILNTTNNDDRFSSSLISPSLSSLSFNKSPSLSRDNSLNFSIKPEEGILDSLSESVDRSSGRSNQNH